MTEPVVTGPTPIGGGCMQLKAHVTANSTLEEG